MEAQKAADVIGGELTYRAAIWASVANIPGTEYPLIDHIPTGFYSQTAGVR